ncbi:MAG: 50S ribosomal protein L15 [Candidatus Omnitrophota bacterium]|nr:50S ribosomal protein L15 [Candidatus Omnitrophota bacterium]
MKRLGELRSPQGATHRKKRVGFGRSSGHGKTSGRGQKGQLSRSGSKTRPGFEGGQTPLIRRVPKRGFTSYQRVPAQIVNLNSLNRFPSGSVVDPKLMAEQGLVGAERHPVKVLGGGELAHPLTIKAQRFSESALKKIAAAGGSAEVIRTA